MDFARATSYAKNLFRAPHKKRLLQGREHGRAIPLADLAIKKSKCTRGLAGALQGVLESLLTPAERWRMSAVEGRTEIRIAGPDFRIFCEGFRMPAHDDGATHSGACVRKPPREMLCGRRRRRGR